MSRLRFEDFTEEEVEQLESMGFDCYDDEATNDDLGLTLVKIEGEWFVPHDEGEGCFSCMEGNWYQLTQWWWEAFDFEDFTKRYKEAEANGTLDDFYY